MLKLQYYIYSILICFLFYFLVSSVVFLWRNPKANQMTVYSEFFNVIKFEKMEEFQK